MKKKFLAIPYLVWMIIFTIIPLILVLAYTFMQQTDSGAFVFTTEYITEAFSAQNLGVLLKSFWYAVVTTLVCLILGYPTAMLLSKLSSRMATLIALLFVLPMWMNFLLRTYAWKALLDMNGPINQFLGLLGIPPQQFLYTEGAIIFGLIYNFLPFMILPIYSVFTKLNYSYVEAAEDLGANKPTVFFKVIFPLTRPGVITGITMVFLPAITTFVISRLLGGSHYIMYGDLIENQFMLLKDWNMGSALSVIMMLFMIISMAIMRKYDKDGESNALW